MGKQPPSISNPDWEALSDRSKRELEDMHARFGIEQVARQIWNDVFTAEDRTRLQDNFEEARERCGGVVGMVMVAWSCSRLEAVIRLCEAFGSYDPITRKRWRRELGMAEPQPALIEDEKPHWNGHTELTFRGEVVRRVRGRSVSTQITKFLDAFQEEGWPEHIDDPLPGPSDSQRLREAIHSLNQGLTKIRFYADGSGTGICWKAI